MLVNANIAPICPRCGGSVMSPVAWPAVTLGLGVYLICCSHCGAVMGSIRQQPDDPIAAAPAPDSAPA